MNGTLGEEAHRIAVQEEEEQATDPCHTHRYTIVQYIISGQQRRHLFSQLGIGTPLFKEMFFLRCNIMQQERSIRIII